MGAGLNLTALRKDGTEVAVDIGLGPIETGEQPLVACAVLEVTEHRAVEARLRQATKMQAIGQLAAGIALEIREKIFDAFFTTKPVRRGTGISLLCS